MEARMFENGDVVKSRVNRSLKMAVTKVYLDQESVDARYWNIKNQSFEDIALFYHEIEKVNKHGRRKPEEFINGDSVRHTSDNSTKLLVISAEQKPLYTCRYWNDEQGLFKEANLYGFELIKRTSSAVPDPSAYSIFP